MKLDHVRYLKQADKKAAVNKFIEDYNNYGCWGEIWDDDNIEYVVGICKECGCPVDENGEALIGCSYSPVHCDICGFKHCDQSC